MPKTEEYEAIEEKLAKGENLSDEEMQTVMSEPNEENSDVVLTPEEEASLDNAGDSDDDDDDSKEDEDKEEDSKDKKSDTSEDKKETDEEKDKKSDTSEDDKKTDEDDDKDDDNKEETLDKVMREIDKPDGQQDLTGFSQKDKGLFFELKRQRQRARDAEEERDQLKFAKVKKDLKAKEEDDDNDKNKEDDDEKDPEDFVTVGDLKKAMKDSAGKPAEKVDSGFDTSNPVMRNYYIMCEKEADSQFEDYHEVIECSEELINAKPDNQKKIAQALIDGKNPAVAMYEIIKADPQFDNVIIVAQARLKAKNAGKKETEDKSKDLKDKAKKAKEDEEKMEANKSKKKTSANHSGSDFDANETTSQQVMTMSDAEFAALPKAKRDSILTKFG